MTTLNLRGNSIGDEGAIAIAEALKVNAVLTNLDLSLNKIGDDAKAIAEALKVNAVLTTLNLGWNSIGVKGAKAIAKALKVTAELKNLRKASARFHRTLSISCWAVCARKKCSPCGIPDIRGLSCSYSCQNIDDAKGALGVTLQVIAEPELAIVL